jgi:PqqD family protein of HPr-rel-A system
VRHWENEVFLFNPHTGDTHVLNDIAWRLLIACAEDSQSESDLLELFAKDAPGVTRGELSEALNDHMDQLMRLGLVEQRIDHETC